MIKTGTKFRNLKIYSSFLFVVPALLAIFYGLYLISAIVTISMVLCYLYHINNEKKYYYIDSTFAWLQMGGNLVLSFISGFPFPYFYAALLLAIISFYIWTESQKCDYDKLHTIWHICSTLITTFCVLGYAFAL